MKVNYKLWLEENGQKVFGAGPYEILQRIDRTGSLRKAASEMQMSYSQAWKLMKNLEEGLGVSLLEKQVGGKSGGGSQLTPIARKLMVAYANFYQEATKSLEELTDKWFSNIES